MSTHHPTFGRNSIGNVFKSWALSFKTTSDVPVQINPLVVGGGSDQQQLFHQLKSGTLPQRASTATKMKESLEKFSILSVPEIWYLARDMCEYGIQSYIRRATLKLMVECIGHDDLSPTSTKLMYYQDIIKYCQLSDTKIDGEFDLFLKALRALTSDGKDIHELVMFDTKLMDFLALTLKALGYLKQTDVTNLTELLRFIKDCIKYNGHSLEEHVIEDMMTKSIAVANSTENGDVIISVAELLSTAVTSGVKMSVFSHTITFLSSHYILNDTLAAISWETVSGLISQGTFYPVVECLCDIITSPDLKTAPSSHPSLNACIGGVQLIEKLIIDDNLAISQSDSVLVYFLPAFKKLATINSPVLQTTLLRTLDRLFTPDTSRDINKVYLFQLWVSNKHSIYDLLNNVVVRSDIDVNYLGSICTSLQEAFQTHQLQTPKDKLIGFFLHNHPYIPVQTVKFVLRYYLEEKLCTVLNPLWTELSTTLLNDFYFHTVAGNNDIVGPLDESLEHDIKYDVLKMLRSSFDISISISKYDFDYSIIHSILLRLVLETDPKLLAYVVKEFFTKMVDKLPFEFLEKALEAFKPFFEIKPITRLKSFVSYPSSQLSSNDIRTSNSLKMTCDYQYQLTKGLCEVVLVQSTKCPLKALEAYKFCVMIANYGISAELPQLLLIVFKVFVRIRASGEGYIYFTNPTDAQGLALAFKRNASDTDYVDNPNFKWKYPETLDYVDAKFYEKPHTLKLFDPTSETLDDDPNINISDYFSLVLNVMNGFVDWEVYSYIWSHFCPQLANMKLFQGCNPQILRLRQVVCDHLTLNIPKIFILPEGFLKSHLQVVFVRSLSSLLCYHDMFSKNDEDEIIRSLLVGIDSWEKTAIPCIHILTVCCYEIPLSIKKYLSSILSKFQTKITSTFASSHILEFLIALINLPPLTSSFHVEDTRRIFGIAFKFIQHSKDAIKNRPEDLDLKSFPDTSDETPSTKTEHSLILLYYVLSSSYTVISTWYLKIELKERRKLSSFLIRNLVLLCDNGMDDQEVAFIDLIIRFTYSDVALKTINPNSILSRFKIANPNALTCNWLIEYCLISITTDPRTGHSLIILRKPTGVMIYNISLPNELLPQNLHNDKPFYQPSHVLLQTIHHLDINNKSKPLPLMEDGVTARAISSFDRIPIVEFHKLGIIYIGRGQTTEQQVLGNQGGSRQYQQFLNSMGNLIRLKECKSIYVGGLDIENDSDGKYGLYWNDSTVQVIFHTTTLMPNKARDKYFDLKKRHIGNNYVNIYYDESGLPYNFNMIKSQFNFMNIVISPHTKHFEIGDNRSGKRFFKVKTYRRRGVPGVFATCHFKIVSEELLLSFIRNLAMNANQFANVWHNAPSQIVSNWGHRVQQLRVLKERTIKSHQLLQQEQQNDEEDARNGVNDAAQSFLEQLHFDSSGSTIENSARYEYLRPDDSEMYKLFEINSFT